MAFSRIKHIGALILLVAIPSCFGTYNQRVVEYEVVKSAGKLLPRTVIPTHYKLKLEPHFNEGYFNGSVEIYITCQESTNTVVLHSHKKLNIDNGEITLRSDPTGENHAFVSISRSETLDALVIVLEEQLLHGATYKLYLEFNSSFSETEEGFHRGKDEIAPEDEKWYGLTVMYPSNARRVFPCFDEPSFRSTFEISVAHSSKMTALSTMPVNHTEPAEKEGWVWDTFAVSPPVPTYAIGIVVSQLNSDTPIIGGNLKLQFHHKRNHIWKAETNLTTYLPQLLQKIIEYFNVSYPFSKIDFIYLPVSIDIDNSAGLLIGSESFDARVPLIQNFVLHFFTHVTTPGGWTDFRILNLLSAYVFDEVWWKMLDREFYHRMFPLQQFRQKYQLFDSPSYPLTAGEWIFKMLSSSLTEDTMRHGLARLIVPDNSETYTVESIWTALNKQGKEDRTLIGSVNISAVAKSWLMSDCQCFPVMTVTRNYDLHNASAEQRIFFHEVDHNATQEEEEEVWWLPFQVIEPQRLDPHAGVTLWFGEKRLDSLFFPNSDKFIIANPMGLGYFLVNYDQRNWQLISQYLLTQPSQLAPETRVKLLNDAFLLAHGGQLSYAVPFNLSLSWQNETNPFMWRVVVQTIDFLRPRCLWSPIEDKINSFMKILMTRMYESINITDDDIIISNLPLPERTTASTVKLIKNEMCTMGYQPCINKLNEKLKQAVSTFEMIDNATDVIIVCPYCMSSCSANWVEEFIKLLSFLSTKSYYVHQIYDRNLGKCPGYVHTVESILNDIFDNNFNFTSSHWSMIVRLLTHNPVSHNITLNFLLQHLDRMNQTSSAFRSQWPYFLKLLFGRMTTYYSFENLLEIQQNYGDKLTAESAKSLNNSLKGARDAAAWYRKSASDINNWIDNTLTHFNITL